nr:hypothetical protein [Tanacetum cinerariifolium]
MVPLVLAFGFAGGGEVVAGLGGHDAGVIPIYRHVFDKLEGVEVLFVVFGQRGLHAALAGGLVVLKLEDAGRVVHRPAHKAGERHDGFVLGRAADAEGVVLVAAPGFAGHPVGVGAREAGGAHRLVHIDGHVVLG